MTLPGLRRLHKWVAVVVLAQVLLWCASGAAFAWLDADDVAGAAMVRDVPRPTIGTRSAFADPLAIASAAADPAVTTAAGAATGSAGATDEPIREVRLEPLGDRWIYRIARGDRVDLHDAATGARVHVDEPLVRALAAARYAGSGTLTSVQRFDAGQVEARDAGAAWAARFDDDASTTLWFADDDGRFLGARTTVWRVRDALWMLHTMDYRGRDDFNHPLVILFASAFAWVALTGVLMLGRVFSRARPVDAAR